MKAEDIKLDTTLYFKVWKNKRFHIYSGHVIKHELGSVKGLSEVTLSTDEGPFERMPEDCWKTLDEANEQLKKANEALDENGKRRRHTKAG